MNLAIINKLNLLEQLYQNIIVPKEVWKELVIDGKGKPGADKIQKSQWIHVNSIKNTDLFRSLKKDLDTGESAAITLAIEKRADIILLDEIEARNIADLFDLKKTGVIGIILLCKKFNIIPSIKPLLDDLRTKANFWINQNLYERVLFNAGETF